MSHLNQTSSTHSCGRLGPTLFVHLGTLFGKQPFHQPFTTTAVLKESMQVPRERKELNNEQKTLVTCVSSHTAPRLTHSRCIRTTQMVCELYSWWITAPLSSLPNSFSVISMFPNESTDWRITHYKQSTIMSPPTGWLYLWPTGTAALSCPHFPIHSPTHWWTQQLLLQVVLTDTAHTVWTSALLGKPSVHSNFAF